MIGYLRGDVTYIDEDGIVIDVAGVGYNVSVTASTAQYLYGKKKDVVVYTYLSVREDAMKLFGFASRDELTMFKRLITVNGIGPKNALGVLAVLNPSDLRFAILSGDAKTISKCPGVGAKSAQKIILELKDKIDVAESMNAAVASSEGDVSYDDNSDARSEAAQALAALGYSATDAMKAVRSVPDSDTMDVETLLKAALAYL